MIERNDGRTNSFRTLKQGIAVAAAAIFVPIIIAPFLLQIVHLFFNASPYATSTFNKSDFVGMVGALAGGVATIAAIIMTTKQNSETQDAVARQDAIRERERVVEELEQLFNSFTDNITQAMAEMVTMVQTADQMMKFAHTHDALSEFILQHEDDDRMQEKIVLCKTLQPQLISWTWRLSKKIDFERFNGCMFAAYRRVAAIADKVKEMGSDDALAFGVAVANAIETLVNNPKKSTPTQDLLDEATARFADFKRVYLDVGLTTRRSASEE